MDEASRLIAALNADLPVDEDLTTDRVAPLRDALGQYMASMDRLNAAMRRMSPFFDGLEAHVEEQFRPSAAAAANSCQQAYDALSDPDASQEDYQRAITRIGQCLERYAAAVSNVKAAHDRAVD